MATHVSIWQQRDPREHPKAEEISIMLRFLDKMAGTNRAQVFEETMAKATRFKIYQDSFSLQYDMKGKVLNMHKELQLFQNDVDGQRLSSAIILEKAKKFFNSVDLFINTVNMFNTSKCLKRKRK